MGLPFYPLCHSHTKFRTLPTNTVEREIRRIPLGRKNALFAGNDTGAQHWALMATLIGSAKLNGVEPLAWITDVLERIVAGRTKTNKIDSLLPWAWQTQSTEPATS